MRVQTFTISSQLRASAAEVWQHAITPAGVNDEFFPLLRMTFPPGTAELTQSWRPGRTLFRSWLLFAGVVPLDYDDVAIAELEPGRRFLERSVLLSQKVWEHERTVEPLPGEGCRITDRVSFAPRVALLGPLYAPIFRFVFAYRHRRLRKRFGSP